MHAPAFSRDSAGCTSVTLDVRPGVRVTRRCAVARGFCVAAIAWAGLIAQASAQTGDVTLWLLPTDGELFPAAGGYPTEDDQHRFFDDTASFFRDHYHERLSPFVSVIDVRRKTFQDPEFARQVLGQRFVLGALSRLVDERGFARTIRVRFFDWVEILGVLERLSAADARELPHVIVAPSTWVAYLHDRGIIRPLRTVDTSAYFESALDTCRVPDPLLPWPFATRLSGRVMRAFRAEQGSRQLVALPWFVDVRLFFYWKDLFAHSAPRNTADFLAVVRRNAGRSATVPPFAVATEADWDLLHSFSLFVWGHGGDWNGGGSFLPAEPSERAIRFLSDLQRTHSASFRHVRRSELEEQFLDRRLGSMVSGPWMLPRLQRALGPEWSARIGVALPPFNAPEHHPTTYLGGMHLALTARGREDAMAHEVLEYLTADAPLQMDSLVAIPASRPAFERLTQSLPGASELRELVESATRQAKHYPVMPEWASIVEAQSTRLELFQMFKHIREDAPELAGRDLGALRARLDWEIRRVPQLAVLAAGASAGLSILGFTWSFWRQRRLRAALAGIRRKRAFADISLRRNRESIESLSLELERTARASERVRVQHDAVAQRTGMAPPAAAAPDIDERADPREQLARLETDRHNLADALDHVKKEIRKKTAELLDLQRHHTAWEIKERDLARGLRNAKGPIKDIPRVSPFIPRLSDALTEGLTSAREEHVAPPVHPAHDAVAPAEPVTGTALDRILGRSTAILELKQRIRDVARSRAKVLLSGEVGTGKELAAQAIHELSGRRGAFVCIDCASIPADMLEAELFGIGPESGLHAVGREGRTGYFEQANGGTVFLDEIGKMPLAQQAKLLRVLETGQVVRVMDRTGRGRRVDVRIIAAYSSDLFELADAGGFDRALLSRLSEFPIHVPALRERKEDIPILADQFLAVSNREHGRCVRLAPEAYDYLRNLDYFDNVRGLRHLVSRIVLSARQLVRAADVEELASSTDTQARLDLAGARRAVRSGAMQPFVKCAAFIVDNIQEFFPSDQGEPERDPARLDAALRRIRLGLAAAAGFDGADYELPEAKSAIVYKAVGERDDLNIHFLYLLVLETLTRRGYHVTVGGGSPTVVREQIDHLRGALFYSDPTGRKAKNTVKWRGMPISDLAREACLAYEEELAPRDRGPEVITV